MLDADYVFVGESDHRERAGDLVVAWLLRESHRCGLPVSCLLLERDHTVDLSGCTSVDTCWQVGRELGTLLFDDGVARELDGVRVLGVDVPRAESRRLWAEYRAASNASRADELWRQIIDGRSRSMAEAAEQAHCNRAIVLLGRAHTHLGVGDAQTPVSDLLAAHGADVSAVSTRCRDDWYRSVGVWDGEVVVPALWRDVRGRVTGQVEARCPDEGPFRRLRASPPDTPDPPARP